MCIFYFQIVTLENPNTTSIIAFKIIISIYDPLFNELFDKIANLIEIIFTDSNLKCIPNRLKKPNSNMLPKSATQIKT